MQSRGWVDILKNFWPLASKPVADKQCRPTPRKISAPALWPRNGMQNLATSNQFRRRLSRGVSNWHKTLTSARLHPYLKRQMREEGVNVLKSRACRSQKRGGVLGNVCCPEITFICPFSLFVACSPRPHNSDVLFSHSSDYCTCLFAL